MSIFKILKDNIQGVGEKAKTEAPKAALNIVSPVLGSVLNKKVDKATNFIAESLSNFAPKIKEFTKKNLPNQYERATAFKESVEQKSLKPLKESFSKQLTEMDRSIGESMRTIGDPSATREQKRVAYEILSGPVMGAVDQGAGAVTRKAVSGVDEFIPEEYVKQNILRREAARKAEKGTVGQRVSETLKKLKRGFVDETAPVQDVLDKYLKENKIKIAPSEDITNSVDRVLRAPTLASKYVQDNGLFKAIRDVDDIDMFDEYLAARQAIDVDTRGFVTGRDIAKDQKLVNALRDKYEGFAGIVDNYTKKLLDDSVDAGLISRDFATSLKQKYPNYVPLNRVFNELDKVSTEYATGGGIGSLSRQNVVKKLKGSERAVESPTASLIKKTYETVTQIEKNRAFQTFTEYMNLPGNPFGIKKIKQSQSTGKNTISGFRNGVKEIYEVPADIERSLKGLSAHQLSWLGRAAALPVRVFKVGTTGLNPAFIFKNLTRDQFTAAINSDRAAATSIINPKVWFKSFLSAVKKDELYDDFVRQAGGGTSFDVLRNEAPATIGAIRSTKNKASRVKWLVKNPADLLRAMEDFVSVTENATRIQQYKGILDDLVSKGVPLKEAKIQAARAARETTANFARHGEYMRVISSLLPYLNAGIQGSRATIRAAMKNPAAFTLKTASLLLLPETTLTLWNMADEKRKAAYLDIPEWEREANFIFVPNDPTQDSGGKWNVIKIPKPPGISNVANFVRRPIEDYAGGDPVRAKELLDSAIGTVSPVEPNARSIFSTLTAQAIRPTVEDLVNQNIFTGAPIVPESMKDLSPELQYRDGTTFTARKAGEIFNISPLRTEAFIKSTFGATGYQALGTADRILAGLGVIDKKDVGGQSFISAIGDAFTKASGGSTSQKTADEIRKLITEQKDKSFIQKQKAELLVEDLNSMDVNQARAKFNEIKKKDPVLAQKALEVRAEQKKNMTYDERLLMQLNVKNGMRAKYIYTVAKDMKPEERRVYLDKLRKKGIITKNVDNQIKKLRSQK